MGSGKAADLTVRCMRKGPRYFVVVTRFWQYDELPIVWYDVVRMR